MLADQPEPAEFLELFETSPVIEFRGAHFNGSGRARGQAGGAGPAVRLRRNPGFQRHVRQDRHQPEPRSKGGMNQKIVAPDVSQSRQDGEFFVGNVGRLRMGIKDLRGRKRQGEKAGRLDAGGEPKRLPVQKKIKLAVVVEIEGSGAIDEILKDAVQQTDAENRRPDEPAAKVFGKAECLPNGRNVGHPGHGKTKIPGVFPEPVGVFPGRNGGKHVSVF